MDSEKMNLSNNLKVLLILCTLKYMYSNWQFSGYQITSFCCLRFSAISQCKMLPLHLVLILSSDEIT